MFLFVYFWLFYNSANRKLIFTESKRKHKSNMYNNLQLVETKHVVLIDVWVQKKEQAQ